MALAQPAAPVRNPYSKLPNWLYPTFVVGVLSLFVVFATWAVFFQPAGHFGVGLGSVLMLVNVGLLSAYTFGCHALRHLAGGNLDCFSCSAAASARFRLWRGITVLNIRHDRWAWASLASVAATDIYIRLLMAGVLHDPRWIA